MCERQIYQRLNDNFQQIAKYNSRLFCVTKDIKMKMKLLDTRIVKGVYIDRSKNLGNEYYTVENDKTKTIYKRKSTHGGAAVNFE